MLSLFEHYTKAMLFESFQPQLASNLSLPPGRLLRASLVTSRRNYWRWYWRFLENFTESTESLAHWSKRCQQRAKMENEDEVFSTIFHSFHVVLKEDSSQLHNIASRIVSQEVCDSFVTILSRTAPCTKAKLQNFYLTECFTINDYSRKTKI